MRKFSSRITNALDALGIPRAGVLHVHSAFGRLSRAGYEAHAFVGSLVDYMRHGTLLMPTMSWRSVNPQNPIFDELATPGITGVLSELFRLEFAEARSLHPTHSVAGRGAMAAALLADHYVDTTPCSDNSPSGRLAACDGQVLMIGVGLECCTLIHHVEEKLAPGLYLHPYEQREAYLCRDRHGREIRMATRRHLKLDRDFPQFEPLLAARGKVKYFDLDGTKLMAFAARDVVDVVARRLTAVPHGTLRATSADEPAGRNSNVS
jgi:aminoglycoside 3-N-acetyltransferase